MAAPQPVREPSRVLLLGDSLGASLTDELAALLAPAGIDFAYAGFPGTGPLTQQGRFWRDQLAAKTSELEPDLVLIQASGNYSIHGSDPFLGADGSPLVHGSVDFFTAWNRHIEDLVARVEAGGARAVIVTAPIAAEHASSHRFADEHNERYRQVASSSGASLLDWNHLLAPDGLYRSQLELAGDDISLRADDGLHFSETGQPAIAAWIVDQLLRASSA